MRHLLVSHRWWQGGRGTVKELMTAFRWEGPCAHAYLHRSFDSLSPFTLNCETPSMNSERRQARQGRSVRGLDRGAGAVLTSQLAVFGATHAKQGNALYELCKEKESIGRREKGPLGYCGGGVAGGGREATKSRTSASPLPRAWCRCCWKLHGEEPFRSQCKSAASSGQERGEGNSRGQRSQWKATGWSSPAKKACIERMAGSVHSIEMESESFYSQLLL